MTLSRATNPRDIPIVRSSAASTGRGDTAAKLPPAKAAAEDLRKARRCQAGAVEKWALLMADGYVSPAALCKAARCLSAKAGYVTSCTLNGSIIRGTVSAI